MKQLFNQDADAPTLAGYATVALEQGIDAAPEGLTYAVPAELADLVVGERVLVPLGKRDKPTLGYVTNLQEESSLDRVKFILERDPKGISLPGDLMQLAQWIGAYYCCPLGMVLVTMLPAAVKKGVGSVREMQVSRIDHPPEDIKLTKLQKNILDTAARLAEQGETWIEMKSLADKAGAKTTGPIKHLIDKGMLTARHADTVRSGELPGQSDVPAPPPVPLTLTDDQDRVLEKLLQCHDQRFGVHLLHGVTGSGKTEVYLRLIQRIMQHDPTAGVIVLVPEIALTPQTVARFVGRFDHVAVLHSALTNAQRHQHWQNIRQGKSRIVVGARSAVFAPLANLRLIIVDEEHEQSYKQDQLPRYHARDVAIKRGQLLNCPVLLGSATPSLESYHNAAHRRTFVLHELPSRVRGMHLPKVQLIDMVDERRQRRGVHLISRRLETLLTRTYQRKGQSMLLLNRRGYANYIACPDHRCGWIMTCDMCDATMVYHKDAALPHGGLVRCHHCTSEMRLPAKCPACGKKVTVFGLGTQRVDEELKRKLPGVRTLRMDSDSMRTGRDYHESLEAFRLGRIDVLVGTQMIAKGLDFPNVHTVGVISGDTSLHMPDFRAAERTFQLIAQVAGRAGRGEQLGQVIVQTYNIQDPTIALAAEHDYPGFAKRELEIRQQFGLPPWSRMARIVVRDQDHARGYEHAARIADDLATFNRHLDDKVILRGPMPCPIARIAGFHRQQIELIAPDAATLQRLLTAMRNEKLLHADNRTAIDVDPVAML